MIERQRIDQRPEAQALGALRDGRQEHAGARRHAKRRRVMLSDVIGVESEPVVDLGQAEAGFVVVAQRQIVAVEMIEDAELHPMWLDGGPRPVRRSCATTTPSPASGRGRN
jgi:hypothetical protein